MKQQIDLYRRFTPPAKGLSAGAVAALALVVALFLLALIYFLGVRETRRLEDQVRRLKGQSQQMATALSQARKTAGPLPSDEDLDREILAVEKKVAEGDQLVKMATRLRQRRSAGFSDYLIPLARKETRGLWLKQVAVSFSEGGDRLLLAGTALQPELIPRFIREMAVTDHFSVLKTAVLKVERSAEDTRRVEFLLETGGLKKP